MKKQNSTTLLNLYKGKRVGESYKTNEGYTAIITEYFNSFNCTIKLDDWNNSTLKGIQYSSLVKGTIKNPYHPSLCGVAYYGIGRHTSRKNGSGQIKMYLVFKSMIHRCYSEKELLRFPTYRGCSVTTEWLNFQNFGDWFEENYVEGYVLDKDILFRGNKVYSSETCCFVPNEINVLFTKSDKVRGDLPIGVSRGNGRYIAYLNIGKRVRKHLGSFDTPEEAFKAYKIAKENHIQEVAIIHYTEGKISKRVYKAMMNYQVEITD